MTIEDFKSNPRTMYTAQEYERILSAKNEAESLLNDIDMKELAQIEIEALTPQLEALWKQMEDDAEAAKEAEEAPRSMILEIQGGCLLRGLGSLDRR
jgi:protein subunit release factor A